MCSSQTSNRAVRIIRLVQHDDTRTHLVPDQPPHVGDRVGQRQLRNDLTCSVRHARAPRLKHETRRDAAASFVINENWFLIITNIAIVCRTVAVDPRR